MQIAMQAAAEKQNGNTWFLFASTSHESYHGAHLFPMLWIMEHY